MSAAGHEPARVAAVLDVGSHSVLLLVVAVDAAGRLGVRDEALATTRLGEGLRPGGRLAAAAAARTAAAVVELAGRARAAGATGLWAFATAAVRDAADGATWAAALSDAARVPVEVRRARVRQPSRGRRCRGWPGTASGRALPPTSADGHSSCRSGAVVGWRRW